MASKEVVGYPVTGMDLTLVKGVNVVVCKVHYLRPPSPNGDSETLELQLVLTSSEVEDLRDALNEALPSLKGRPADTLH